ncbi:hypothetical protein BKP45_06820 [Anaerobacillus alkalidiazotrophicus]|uniref:Uncharacterized protein n=2 Tax=Anaerobacillus alkalidiazotrophicus TaxID=472963 RepID=A0A1S2MCP1_9BACI|nr:hypothetical protein BKP45_06820 [Anaerobacillus alkalidiazotrophicus]
MELDEEIQKSRNNETEKIPHFKQKFTILQTIGLLVITLLLSTGGGIALGNAYFWNSGDMKRINEQLEFYQEKVSQDPNNLEDRIVLGYTYYLKGDNKNAINQFKTVVDKDENYFDAYYNLGLVYLEEDRHYDALSMFNKTVQLAPRDFKGHAQMGITYRHLKMYNEAIEALSEANNLAPANADIIYQIGLVAEEVGEYEAAVEIYKDVLNYDPLFQPALEALERAQNVVKEVGDNS